MNRTLAKDLLMTAKSPTSLLILLGGIGIGIILFLLLINFSAFSVVALPVASLSLWLMHQMVRVFSLRRLTIPGFWYLSYLVMIFIPSFYIAVGKPDGLPKDNYLFAVESILLTAPLGVLAASIIFAFRPVEIERYFASSVIKRTGSSHLVIAYSIFLLGAVGLTTLYVVEARTIPLFKLLGNTGAYDELAQLRETSFKLLGSRFAYGYHLLRQVGFPFLIMVALGSYLMTRHLIWLFVFLTALGSGVLYAAFSLAKAPVAVIVLTLFLFLYLYFGGKIHIKGLISGSISIVAFPVAVVALMYSVSLPIALRVITRRLLDDPARQLFLYFEVVPQKIDYLHGMTISVVARLMGQKTISLANYVAFYDNPALIERGLTSASANAAFIGDLHGNFGIAGVVVGGFLAGFLMQAMQIYLLRQPKIISNLAIYAFLMFGSWYINLTALQTMLLSGGILFAFMLAWAIRFSEAFLGQSVSVSIPMPNRITHL